MDDDNVGMVESTGCFGFLREPLLANRIGNLVVGQHLDSDGSVQAGIVSLVDHTHSSLTEFGFNSVAVQRLAGFQQWGALVRPS